MSCRQLVDVRFPVHSGKPQTAFLKGTVTCFLPLNTQSLQQGRSALNCFAMLRAPQRGAHMESSCCSIPSVTESDRSLRATCLSRCSSTFTEDWSCALWDTELFQCYTRTFSPHLSALVQDFIKGYSAEKLSLDLTKIVSYVITQLWPLPSVHED